MQVETYEVGEVTSTVEQSEEAKKLVAELGLDEQERFYAPDQPAVCPYRKMTAAEAFVYEQLLPVKTKFHKFGDEAIPLRVLQVAAHALTLFDKDGVKGDLMVWHSRNADIKDPLLVLSIQNGSTTERFILARWGEILENFTTLTAKAKELWKAERIAEVAKGISDLETYRNSIDAIVESVFAKGTSRGIYVSTAW